MAIVLIQPALALVSSAWGQVDSIFTLFILIAFLAIPKNIYLSSLFIFLSLLIKPQAMLGALVYFIYLVSKKDKREIVRGITSFVLIGVVSAGLFSLVSSAGLFTPYTSSVGRYTNVTLNAFNLWWLFFANNAWNVADTTGKIISFRQAGFVLFAIFLVPPIIYLFSKKRSVIEAIFALSYVYLIFFVFPTEIHERYLYPAVAFMGIAAVLSKQKFAAYLALSVGFLVNIYAVLEGTYPQFHFFKTNLMNGGWTRLISLVNLLVALYLGYELISDDKNDRKKEKQTRRA